MSFEGGLECPLGYKPFTELFTHPPGLTYFTMQAPQKGPTLGPSVFMTRRRCGSRCWGGGSTGKQGAVGGRTFTV